jgi:uncharacterized membrane protein YraQ (UPF0718 family)
MGGLVGTAVLWCLALALGVVAALRPGRMHARAASFAVNQFVRLMPRLALAMIAAGFLGALLPGEWIAALIGPESGAYGIFLASAAGGFTPGGPIISFPILVVLREAGAGLPQIVAFLTAWSVFAFHRVLIYEATLMGWRFSGTRLFASLILPPLAGFSAQLVSRLLGFPGW